MVGVFNGMGGGSSAVQKRETIAYQWRSNILPLSELSAAERYDFRMLGRFYHMLQ